MKANAVYCTGSLLLENGLRLWLTRSPFIKNVKTLDIPEGLQGRTSLLQFRNIDLIILRSDLCDVLGGYLERINDIQPSIKTLLIDLSNGREEYGLEVDKVLKVTESEKSFQMAIGELLGHETEIANNLVTQEVSLTEQEVDILRLICQEKSNEQIAYDLFKSKRTIEGARTRMMKKLGLSSTIGLVKYAIKNGIYAAE